MIPRWFSRLSLLWKILLSTSVAVTLLFGVTGEIVLNHISQTMSDSLNEEVDTSFRAYQSLWNSRAALLSSVSSILSTLPGVKLAFGTGDEATIRDSAQELWSKISEEKAIFLVTDPGGKVVASLGGDIPPSLRKNMDVVRQAAAQFPKQASGFFLQDGELYHISVTPVYVDSPQGQSLINVLVAGIHVDAVVLQELKQQTGGSEFLFETPERVIASTLNERATRVVLRNVARASATKRVSDGVVEYAWFPTKLEDVNHKPVGQLLILRSFEGVQRRLTELYTNIILLWVVAVSAGFVLTYVLARRIVEPVKQLDRAAAEVARQNYAIEVAVTSEDEMGRLARTFNTMCASIRQAREDLIRQERISTIGRLSASIVHDLRNPLAAIYGGAEMLVDRELPPGHVRRLAGNIYQASRRIQELLQDLLDVSRGKTRPMEVCRLREAVSAAIEALGPAAEAQGVQLILAIPAEIELPLDRSRMERTFVNLISNALEAMPGGGEVRISAALEKGSVLVQVADNGPGVSPEIRSQLFQPFVSAGKRNGLGLGLALTRQTVLDHGGDIWVESEPGHGARFCFRLPGAQVAQPHGARV
ncbi:MAG: HAMP domain-containing protein [Acidobacteriia bacterium]|nr:HAMP domain-containing protein [Terriglobia bacterium]